MTTAQYTLHSDRAITRARKLAKDRQEVMAVVEIDEGDGRAIRVVTNEYTYGPEFDAFNGHLIAEVHPCGDVQGEW